MRYEIYPAEAGRWSWRLLADDGKEMLAISSDSYDSKLKCHRTIELVKISSDAEIVEKEPVPHAET